MNATVHGVRMTALVASWRGPAAADHSHVILLGNGQCVTVAGNAQEKHVVLPRRGGLSRGGRRTRSRAPRGGGATRCTVNVRLGQFGIRNGEPLALVGVSAEAEQHCGAT